MGGGGNIGKGSMRKILLGSAGCLAACVWYFRLAAAEPSSDTLQKGARLYAVHCRACHGDREGRGTMAGAQPHNKDGHSWHHPDVQLKDWILNGKPGPLLMPAFGGKLTEADAEAILAFIKTWWTLEQREIQADISKRFEEAFGGKKKSR